jgi:hydroxyethylthiazole kinase-like uncharacterized protein yjeF
MRTLHGTIRVNPAQRPCALHDAQATRWVEAAAAAARPDQPLMELAGKAVARLGLALAGPSRAAQLWCGPGNNGGDGLVAARWLHAAGWTVQAVLLADPDRLPPDARRAWQAAVEAGVPIARELPQAADVDAQTLVIDALLGLGARRAPGGAVADAIARINAHAGPVLAVDLPSGLHPDTGILLGPAAVRSTATLALLTVKPGCCTAAGRDHAGALWLDELGGPQAPAATAWLTAGGELPPRPHASHKGSHGDVAVVGGASGMVGAAWLAARAALAAGAGRAFCSPLDAQASLFDGLRPELMGRFAWWQSDAGTLRDTTVACGCGGGDAVAVTLPALLSQVRRLVLDADALNAIAADAGLQRRLQARASHGLQTLLTPHPLEAARLSGTTTEAVQADRIAAAQTLADQLQAAVLLKGSGSVIAAPGALPCVNATGNAALATAGSGDVLAGWAAGLWAQMPAASAQAVAVMAAGQHGAAADRWQARGHGGPLRASDLIEALAARHLA